MAVSFDRASSVHMIAAAGLAIAGGELKSRATSSTPCDQAAQAYLLTTASLGNGGQGSITFEFAGNAGNQQFTFASGTLQSDIIAAINSFAAQTGVAAEACDSNNSRAQLISVLHGANAFVRANQLNGSRPLIYPAENRGTAGWRLIAHGADGMNGDANCDERVDQFDLSLVFDHWGVCPVPPAACAGDLDGNNVVDVDDILRVIINWGERE